MTSFTSKALRVQDPRPIGEIIQSPYDLTKVSTQFTRCDGRVVNRYTYPQLANLNPNGVLTFTNRTTAVSNSSNALAADTTNFVMSGSSTIGIQASPDGITWTSGSGWTANNFPTTIIVANTRFVIMSNAGADFGTPLVTATGQTAANTGIKGNWTSTTVATGFGDPQCLAYSPTLASTVFVPNTAASTTFYTLADGATAWVARTAPSSQQMSQVCWDGKYFWITHTGTSNILTRWDGTTAVDIPMPMAVGTSIASNGSGTIVVISVSDTTAGSTGGMPIVSNDFGTTWDYVHVPQFDNSPDLSNIIYCANGLFKLGGSTIATRISRDGYTWTPPGTIPNGPSLYNFAYKAGVYFVIEASTGAAHQTFIEDMTKMVLPRTQRKVGSPAVMSGNVGWQEWIKVS